MAEELNTDDVDQLLKKNSNFQFRYILLITIILIGSATFWLYPQFGEEEISSLPEPRPEEVTQGRIVDVESLSGITVVKRSSNISFGTAGIIQKVMFNVGDRVRQGELLASLQADDALRKLETSSIQLEQAKLQLEQLQAAPDLVDLSSAKQTIASAESQVAAQKNALATLLKPASEESLATAEQSVANAKVQLSKTKSNLQTLRDSASKESLSAAEQSTANARVQLSKAESDLLSLQTPASDSDIAVANSDVALTQSKFAAAQSSETIALDKAVKAQENYCDNWNPKKSWCFESLPLASDVLAALTVERNLLGKRDQLFTDAYLDASSVYGTALSTTKSEKSKLSIAQKKLDDLIKGASTEKIYQAEQSVLAAKKALTAALERQKDLLSGAQSEEIYQAEQSVLAAEKSLSAALERQNELKIGATTDEIVKAEAALHSAETSLKSAQAKYEDLMDGPLGTELTKLEQNIKLAEINVEGAESDIKELSLFAPFDGVISEINIFPDDRVNSNTVAVVLDTPEDVTLELTASEAEILTIKSGQMGFAEFNSIEDIKYPIRITHIGTVPNMNQGVITYRINAEIIQMRDLLDTELRLLNSLGSFETSGMNGLGSNADSVRRGRGERNASPEMQALREQLENIELPEGTTWRDVIRAVATGAPLPEGVILPEGISLPTGTGLQQQANENNRDNVSRGMQMPLPGMNASVDILIDIKENVLQIPSIAVRQQGTNSYVVVQNEAGNFARKTIKIGDSDGQMTEVVEGLALGDIVFTGISAPAEENFSLSNVEPNVDQPTQNPSNQRQPPGRQAPNSRR